MDGKVCAVITTHNRSCEIVKRAIKSVLGQTYQKFELIIVDDSRNDYSERKLIADYVKGTGDPRISYIQNMKNLGACASRNIGAAHCQSDFIAFLDDDDEWVPEKLEKMLPAFSDEKIGLVYSSAYIYNQTNKTITILRSEAFQPQGNVFRELLGKNIIGGTSYPLIRREAFAEVGEFRTDMPALQDWELWLRIASHYDVAYVPEHLSIYYEHQEERISLYPEKRVEGFEYIRKKYAEYYAKDALIRREFYGLGIHFYKNAHRKWKALYYSIKRYI